MGDIYPQEFWGTPEVNTREERRSEQKGGRYSTTGGEYDEQRRMQHNTAIKGRESVSNSTEHEKDEETDGVVAFSPGETTQTCQAWTSNGKDWLPWRL